MSVVTQFPLPPPLRLSAGSAISCILRPTVPMCTAPSVPRGRLRPAARGRQRGSLRQTSPARRAASPAQPNYRRANGRLAGGDPLVVYCAGPHCNGADVAALKLAELGRPVKMMLGGLTGWEDEGYAFVSGK